MPYSCAVGSEFRPHTWRHSVRSRMHTQTLTSDTHSGVLAWGLTVQVAHPDPLSGNTVVPRVPGYRGTIVYLTTLLRLDIQWLSNPPGAACAEEYAGVTPFSCPVPESSKVHDLTSVKVTHSCLQTRGRQLLAGTDSVLASRSGMSLCNCHFCPFQTSHPAAYKKPRAPKPPLPSHCQTPPPTPRPKQPLAYFLSAQFCLFCAFPINGLVQQVLLSAWLLTAFAQHDSFAVNPVVVCVCQDFVL